MQLSKPPKPKATRKRVKKEILSDDFKKRKIFWKIFHLTSLLIYHPGMNNMSVSASSSETSSHPIAIYNTALSPLTPSTVLLKRDELHSVIVMTEIAITAAASVSVEAKSCGYSTTFSLKYYITFRISREVVIRFIICRHG
jgi:hypothetical protein